MVICRKILGLDRKAYMQYNNNVHIQYINNAYTQLLAEIQKKHMSEKTISTLSELTDNLRADIGAYDEDVWYRGQSDFKWKLSPGIFRYSDDVSELTLMTRFKQSASLLIDTSPKDDFDWMFLMQHYGVPTRLLDWTESPLIALYFAVNGEDKDIDSSLWMLKPIELNKKSNIKTKEKNFIPSFDDEFLKSYDMYSINSNKRVELSPIATIASRNNTRIQAQLGVFTIHVKYKIPKEAKENLRKELDLLSINKFSLFPELSSIGDILKSKLK